MPRHEGMFVEEPSDGTPQRTGSVTVYDPELLVAVEHGRVEEPVDFPQGLLGGASQ